MERTDDSFFGLLAALFLGVIECLIEGTYLALRMIAYASSLAIGNGKDPRENRNNVEEMSCTDKIFEFFNLPRELRDQIIDELLDHEQTLRGQATSGRLNRLRVTVADYVQDNLLLVNRQFRTEIQERAQKLSGFTFEGSLNHFSEDDFPKVPACVPSLPYVELRVLIIGKTGYQLARNSVAMKTIAEQLVSRLSEHSTLQGIFLNVFIPPLFAGQQPDGTDGITNISRGLSCLTHDGRVKAINVYAPAKYPTLKLLTPAWRAKSILENENLVLYYTPKTAGLQRVK